MTDFEPTEQHIDPSFIGPFYGGVTSYGRLHTIGQRLLSRLPEAHPLPFREVSIGTWKPCGLQCASNARTWVSHNPGWERVRGYTFFDHRDLYPWLSFAVHNIVRSPEGELIDITPDWAPDELFIEHIGPEEEHDQILAELGAVMASRFQQIQDARAVLYVADRVRFFVDRAKAIKGYYDAGYRQGLTAWGQLHRTPGKEKVASHS